MSTTNNNRQLSKEALAAIPVLRSLIISEKGTSTVKRILADYAKEEGQSLPFRQFGFPSAIEYLKATGEFVLQTHLGETSIFVKPSKDSTHILKMVAAQKSAKAKQPAKRNGGYTWNNPQYQYNRFKVQNGFQHKPQSQSQPKYSWNSQQQMSANPNNPLKRFFQDNAANYHLNNIKKENQPPQPPALTPKTFPSLAPNNQRSNGGQPISYAKVTSVKVEPCEPKPAVVLPPKTNENIPPPQPTVPKQAYIRPLPSNNYPVKNESGLSQNPFLNDILLQAMAKSPCNVQNQKPFPSNPFMANQQRPPGYNYPQPTPFAQPQIVPSSNYPMQNHQNPFPTNPFRTVTSNQQPPPPFANIQRSPFNQLQQRNPPPLVPSEHVINLLDQQVQLLHESVKDLKHSYQRSQILLHSTINQEVDMMDAIVRHYQETMTHAQHNQKAAVDRLNQQLEELHASCRASHFGA